MIIFFFGIKHIALIIVMFDFILFHLIMLVITSDITIVKYISDGAYVCQQP